MLLSSKEIARAKTRFALLAGAIGLLVFLIVFQQGLLGGLVTGFVGAVENQDSPILVFNEQARQNVEGSFLLPDQVSAVAAVDGVAESNAIGEGTFTVEVTPSGEREASDADAVLFGYKLDGLGAPLTLNEGRLPEGPNEAVASSADAEKGFGIGQTVRVVGKDGPDITVVGLGSDLRWSVTSTLFLSYDTYEAARRAVNPDAPIVLPSLVAVEPADSVSTSELTARIDAGVDGVQALTKQQAADENPGVQGVSQSFNIILGLAFLVVTLVVGFFFLILTVQKSKPLTLLRAIGSPTAYLVKNLLLQIFLVMVAGTAIGVGLAGLASVASVSGDVSIDLNLPALAVTISAIFVLAFLGGIVSIRRVLRIDPIRATVDTGRTL